MTNERNFNAWVEDQTTDKLSGFPFSVFHNGSIVGRFSTEPYAKLMMDTLIRADLIHELGSGVLDEILNVLIDQVSELQSRKWIAPSK
jgi:hypothetical protein